MTTKRSRGRPVKYKQAFASRVGDFALVGMTNDEIAGALKVDRATLYRWKSNYPDFSETIKRGRDCYDTEVIERALQQQAAGYD